MNVGSLSRSALKDKIPTEDHTLQWRAARLHFRLQGVMPRTFSFGAIDVQLHRTSSADRTRTEHMARHRRGGLHRFQPVADAAVTRAARRGPRQLPHRVSAQSDMVRELVTPEQWERFRFMEGDIRDVETCLQACQGAEHVLHEAALGSVPRSIENPIMTNGCNIDGFLNMLVAARDCGVKSFVYAASSSTYGDEPQPAQAGRPHRQAPLALRRDQVRKRALRRGFRAQLWLQDHRPALLQRVRTASGPVRRVCGGDPPVGSPP